MDKLDFLMLNQPSANDLKEYLLNTEDDLETKSATIDLVNDFSILNVTRDELDESDMVARDDELNNQLIAIKKELYQELPYDLYKKGLKKLTRQYVSDFIDDLENHTFSFSDYKQLVSVRNERLKGHYTFIFEMPYMLALTTENEQEELELIEFYKGFLKNKDLNLTAKFNRLDNIKLILNPYFHQRYLNLLISESNQNRLSLLSNLTNSYVNIDFTFYIHNVHKFGELTPFEFNNIKYRLLQYEAIYRQANVYYNDFYKLLRTNPVLVKCLFFGRMEITPEILTDFYNDIDTRTLPLTQEEFQLYIAPLMGQ